MGKSYNGKSSIIFFFFFFSYYLWDGEKHWFVASLIYAFTACFLYVEIEPTTLASQANALTNWASWLGPEITSFSYEVVKQVEWKMKSVSRERAKEQTCFTTVGKCWSNVSMFCRYGENNFLCQNSKFWSIFILKQ